MLILTPRLRVRKI